MELNEISKKLETIGIPVAYLKFTKPQKLPFIVFFESGTEIEGADSLNLYRRVDINIELYSDSKPKGIKIERKIESLFSDTPIHKDGDVYLPDEEMYMTSFSFETIQSLEED